MEKSIINNKNEGNNRIIQDNISLINSINRNINNDNLNNINFNNNNEINNSNHFNNVNNIKNDIYKSNANIEGENIYSNNSSNTKPLNDMKKLTYDNNSIHNNNKNNINIINPHSYNINNNIYKIYYNMPIFSKNNQNKKNINDKYSYECINGNNLQTNIYKGENQAQFNIKLKNTGPQPWLKGMGKLIFESSNFKNNSDIMLDEQKKGEEKTYKVIFENLEKYQEGDYSSDLRLNINGQNIGKPIKLNVSIKTNNNELMKY